VPSTPGAGSQPEVQRKRASSGYIRESPESPSGPEAVRFEREAGGDTHARHSGLVWDERAGKSLDQSYVAANNAANRVARVDAKIDARSGNDVKRDINKRGRHEVAAGSKSSKNSKNRKRRK
jgi:hypothetical protein